MPSPLTLCAYATVVAGFCFASSAAAQIIVPLSGAQEVSANLSNGYGTATVTFDATAREVFISGSHADLQGDVTAAHLHGLAPAGVNAAVLIHRSVDGGVAGNFSGSGTLSEANFDGFLNCLTYINVHTVDFPGGEIRGQVIIPEPAMALSAFAAAGLLLCRRRSC